MAYCGQCGAENAPDSNFCVKCGKPLGAARPAETPAAPPQPPPPQAPPGAGEAGAPARPRETVRNCLVAATVIYGVGAVLAMAMGVWWAAVLSAGLCAAVYCLGVQKLKEGDVKSAQGVSLGVGIVACVFGVRALSAGDLVGLVANGGAAGALLYANSILRKQTA